MCGKNINNVEKQDMYASFKDEELAKEEFDWYIEIPKIEVYAPIEEGTDEEVLNKFIGHFENTSRRNGNCGLIAYNVNYNNNYFAKLKELEKDDIVYYFVDGKKYKYKVKDNFIVYETDLTMLDETKENMITLITYVENRDKYRLCVQCILEEW